MARNAQTNPFDTSIFNEVRPTYVGPPIEDFKANRETLTKAYNENEASTSVLDSMMAETKASLNLDPKGVEAVNAHINNFKTTLDNIVSTKGMAYAGDAINQSVRKFVQDVNIKNRQGLQADWLGQRDAVIKNDKIDFYHRNGFDKYQKHDPKVNETGEIVEKSNYFTPVEHQDVNGLIFDAVKLMAPDAKADASYKFVDSQGRVTTQASPDMMEMVIETESGTKKVSKEDLNKAFTSALKNNPKMLDYLMQEDALRKAESDGKVNPIELIKQAKADPSKYDEVLSNAVKGLSESMEYIQTEYGTKASPFNIFDKASSTASGTSGTETPIIAQLPGGTTPRILSTPEEVHQDEQAVNTMARSLFTIDQNNKPLAQSAIDELSQASISGNYDKIVETAKKYGQDPVTVLNSGTMLRSANDKRALAENKKMDAFNTINKTGKFSSLNAEPTEPEQAILNQIKEAGFDWHNGKGVTKFEKIYNTLEDFKTAKAPIQHITKMSANPRTGGVTYEDNVFTNKKDEELYNSLSGKYSNSSSLYRKYEKTLNEQLAVPNEATTASASTQMPFFQYTKGAAGVDKGNDTNTDRVFRNPEFYKGMPVYDSNMNKIDTGGGSMDAIVNNADEIQAFSTNRSVPGSPRMFMVTFRTKPDATNKQQGGSRTFYVPMGDKGITTEMYDQYVARNPKVQSEDLINNYIYSNPNESEFSYPNHPNVKLSKSKGSTDIRYRVMNPKTGEWMVTDKMQAINAMSSNIEYANSKAAANYISSSIASEYGDDKLSELKSITNPQIADIISILGNDIDKTRAEGLLEYLKNRKQYE